jgi:hypothetical protein
VDGKWHGQVERLRRELAGLVVNDGLVRVHKFIAHQKVGTQRVNHSRRAGPLVAPRADLGVDRAITQCIGVYTLVLVFSFRGFPTISARSHWVTLPGRIPRALRASPGAGRSDARHQT